MAAAVVIEDMRSVDPVGYIRAVGLRPEDSYARRSRSGATSPRTRSASAPTSTTARSTSPGGSADRVGPGESATFAPGVAHRFWNAGEDELVCTGFVRPPDNLEYFLSEIFASTRRNGGKRPGMFDAAYLLRRYGDEFGMTVPPQPVQRILVPVVVAVGRVLGWDRRFAGAPGPVRRSLRAD